MYNESKKGNEGSEPLRSQMYPIHPARHLEAEGELPVDDLLAPGLTLGAGEITGETNGLGSDCPGVVMCEADGDTEIPGDFAGEGPPHALNTNATTISRTAIDSTKLFLIKKYHLLSFAKH